MNTFAKRVLAANEYTFRFIIDGGSATFSCTARDRQQAWLTIIKEEKSLLRGVERIELSMVMEEKENPVTILTNALFLEPPEEDAVGEGKLYTWKYLDLYGIMRISLHVYDNGDVECTILQEGGRRIIYNGTDFKKWLKSALRKLAKSSETTGMSDLLVDASKRVK